MPRPHSPADAIKELLDALAEAQDIPSDDLADDLWDECHIAWDDDEIVKFVQSCTKRVNQRIAREQGED